MVQRRILVISSVSGICLIINPVNSQIIPDGTTETTIINNCQNSCNIVGGTVAEQNLFHSFQEFNVSFGERVYFADPGVANIFSRITGSNSSEIFGVLGISGGDANLFLLNPNGIVFGQGATLDLNGSFFATTADKIQFGDRGLFSSNPDSPGNIALLTVNPSALFFNQVGQNASIVLEGANLTLPAQKDFTLLGQASEIPGILIKNSNINVFEGNIALG